jgi:hypothetical protein
MRYVSRRFLTHTTWLFSSWLILSAEAGLEQDRVFEPLVDRLQRQIQLDKQDFVIAQTCTEWFYRQQSPPSSRPKAQPIGRVQVSDCARRYPGGLVSAREDFNRMQSLLTVSLTSYEYALVADGNDDQAYSPGELQDMLEAVGLSFQATTSPEANLTTLHRTFSQMRDKAGLEALVAGIARLYDKGYRLTTADRMALNHVIG